MNIESIEHVAERSGKARLSLNRLGNWYKCRECGCTFLGYEPQPEKEEFTPSPQVFIDLMERDEEDEQLPHER